MRTLLLASIVAFCFPTDGRAAEDCLQCHDDVMSKANKHAPAADSCTTCHADHKRDSDGQPVLGEGVSKENPYHLINQVVEELCFQCHDKADFKFQPCRNAPEKKDNCGHPFGKWPEYKSSAGYRSTTHPAFGLNLKDPWRQEKPFDCLSCHNPHSSDGPKLFRYRIEGNAVAYRGAEVNCTRCHGGLKDDTDAPLIQGAACAVCHYEVAFSTPRISKPAPDGSEGASLNPIPDVERFYAQLKSGSFEDFKKSLSGKALENFGSKEAMERLKTELAGTSVKEGAQTIVEQQYAGQFEIKGVYKVPIQAGDKSAGQPLYTAVMRCTGETKVQPPSIVTKSLVAGHIRHDLYPGRATVVSVCTVDDLIKAN